MHFRICNRMSLSCHYAAHPRDCPFSSQVQAFVVSLGELHEDISRFKLSLRDFLIQLKEFAGDNAELFLEEKELEAQRKAQEEREAAARVPGLLKPSQIKDEDEEL